MTEVNLEELIDDIKDEYKKSNVRKLDLDESLDIDIQRRLCHLIEQAPKLSDKEYAINFDPVQNMFLQKMVTENVLNKRVILTKDDYFKGIVYVDYLTSTILGSHTILDDFYEISQHLGEINPTLDPDLPLFTLYSALFYKGEGAQADKKAFDSANTSLDIQYAQWRPLSPLYEAVGEMTYELFSDETIRAHCATIEGSAELKALLFIDTVKPHIKDTDAQAVLDSMVVTGEYFNASQYAIKTLAGEISERNITDYVKDMVK